MAGEDVAIRVDNLDTVRRDLRTIGDREALKAVQAVTKSAAEIVAVQARSLAPRRTGALASSIVATTSGNKGIVRSPLPYAAVVHWGGTIHPRGAPITFKRTEFIYRAFDQTADQVAQRLADGFDDVFRTHGFT